MPRSKKIRRQPPIKGGRVPSYSGFTPELRRWVEREADRFRCYPSFVIATCVAIQANYEEQPDYKQPPSKSGAKFPETPLKLVRAGGK